MVIIMSKGILTTISIFAIAIIAVIVGFFLLDIEKVALIFWAFGSLLFSLVVSLLVTIILVSPKKDKERVFYTAGLSGAVWVYAIAVVISILFTKSFADRLNSFIFLQIGINALFFITAIVIITVSGHIYSNDESTYEKFQKDEYNRPKRGGF